MSTCSAPNCARPTKAKGLCSLHYQRLKRGKPLADPVVVRNLSWREALDHYLDGIKGGEGCWVWPLTPDSKGYGRLDVGGHRRLAHRMSWHYHCGPIPPGYFVDHKCRNRLCVNPAHLRLVTPTVNTLENSVGVAAMGAAQTHCVNGHLLDGDNLLRRRDRPNNRVCRECGREAQRRYKARRRAADTVASDTGGRDPVL